MTQTRAILKTAQLTFVIFMTMSSFVWAQSNATDEKKNTQPNPLEDKSYAECVDTCLYEQANQQIAVMIVYNQNLFERVRIMAEDYKAALKAPSDPNLDIADLKSALKKELKHLEQPDDKSILDAYARFQEIHRMTILKARAAYLQNKNSITGYRTDSASIGEPGASDQKAFAKSQTKDDANKKPLIPYLPTYYDLEEAYKRLKPEHQPQFKDWAKNLLIEPTQADFYIYEKKKVPPSDKFPDGQEYLAIKKDSSGAPMFDKDAFNRAKAEYLKSGKAVLSKTSEWAGGLKKVDTDPRTEYFNPNIATKRTANVTDAQKDAYRQTRKVFIEAITPKMKDGKVVIMSTENFSGKKPHSDVDKNKQGDYLYKILEDKRGPAAGKLDVNVDEETMNQWVNQSYGETYETPKEIFVPKPKKP